MVVPRLLLLLPLLAGAWWCSSKGERRCLRVSRFTLVCCQGVCMGVPVGTEFYWGGGGGARFHRRKSVLPALCLGCFAILYTHTHTNTLTHTHTLTHIYTHNYRVVPQLRTALLFAAAPSVM